MIRHPSENFIKYLMTHPYQQSANNDWVQGMILSFGFPPAQTDYLAWLRGELSTRMPADFRPSDRYHRPSSSFMKSECIYGLHHPDNASRGAQGILSNLRARPLVESMLLGRMEPKEVAKKVNARLGEFYTTNDIDAYRNYYWNVALLRVEDWNELYAAQEHAVQRQNANAIVQVGPSMALHKMGFQQQIDSKSILRSMQETLFFDFQEWKTRPHGSERSKALTALARTSVMVDVQMSQADSAMKDSLKAFEQFRMKHAAEPVRDMKDLAPGGNYSGSGARMIDIPLNESEQEEEAGE